MKPETIITELRLYNRWRRGDEAITAPDPTALGKLLDAAADSLTSLIASNTTLRRERREARAEVAQLKGALALGQENCDAEYEALREERDTARDGLRDSHIRAEQLEARVKELEAELASEKTTRNAIIAKGQQAEARVKELQKQEAESRRLFYSEQDKRQSAEYRCDELAGALQVITDLLSKTVKDFGGCDHSVGVCMCEEIRACDNANNVLARHAAGEPAKHPDTERLDWLEGDPQARLAEVRRLIFTDRDTAREAIDAARREVQP